MHESNLKLILQISSKSKIYVQYTSKLGNQIRDHVLVKSNQPIYTLSDVL